MNHRERAQVIYDDLTNFHKLDPVAWLATVLSEFEREIRNERNDVFVPETMAAAAAIPDGED